MMISQRSKIASASASFVICLALSAWAAAAEVIELSPELWDGVVPQGKEVDAIYGDYVLRSDKIVAVIARPGPERHANLKIKNVGGALIDLTFRNESNDQLGCFYPHSGVFAIASLTDWPKDMPRREGAAHLAFALARQASSSKTTPTIVVGYELADGDDYIVVRSLIQNTSGESISFNVADGIMVGREFTFGLNSTTNHWWCQDRNWGQAYGIAVTTPGWKVSGSISKNKKPRSPISLTYNQADLPTRIASNESLLFERQIHPAVNSFNILQSVSDFRGLDSSQVTVKVTNGKTPVQNASVRAMAGKKVVVASGKTDAEGMLVAKMPQGKYRWIIESHGRKNRKHTTNLSGSDAVDLSIELAPLGQVAGIITDELENGVPCRLAFFSQGLADPDWGPDSGIHGVRNLWHTHDGNFKVEMLPGKYKVIISRGPEFDAIAKEIEVVANETTNIHEQLVRSVSTAGWLSAELHSHSSPSGDNTSSQRGRVLNLLVDHLEFIPCTEHQRIDSYEPHLKHFNALDRVLTCSGMELTGQPLPLNHQNSFPLVEHRHRQNGGGPTIHPDPEVQIQRIAMWDNGSDKVVQINHPNIPQMIGDRDRDGKPDRGFSQMLHFADVMEVHPPGLILSEPEVDGSGHVLPENRIFCWMQMLNLGYRVPGVVNTDAHWNYYGSGFLRNFVKCASENPAEANLMDVCHAIEAGQVVMTNGPFLEVTALSGGKTAGPGDDLISSSATVRLRIKVQCPNWLDVNRVQIFLNGRPAEDYNFLRRKDSEGFGRGVTKFEYEFDLPLKEDTHVIVAAAGEGQKLGIVYGEKQGAAMPVAVSNPIFVDVDGNGFQANGDTLGAPLPVTSDHHPTHGHSHSHEGDHAYGHRH